MLPASLAAMVPVFMATPTSACASAGASLVPSPVMATRRPPACSFLIRSILSLGVAWARKSSMPASAAMAAAVSGLSPVIMTVRMPMARNCSKRSRMPPLTMSFRCTTPSARSRSATTSGVPPVREMRSVMSISSVGTVPPCSWTNSTTESVAPLRMRRPSMIHAAHARLGGEGNEVGFVLGHFAAANVVRLLGQHHDGAAFGSLVGQAGKLRGVGQFGLGDAVHGNEFHRLAIAQRDGAGLIEQQRVDVAGGFHGLAAHGQHVVLHHAIHAGDADGGKQAADGGGNQADQQRDQHGDAGGACRCRWQPTL